MLKSTHHTSGGTAAGLGGGCAGLFGSVFILAGLAVGYFAYFPAVVDWWRSAEWEETPCWIEKVELKASRSSKGGSTHSVKAVYRYEFRGKTHRSERVSLLGGGDNMGDYQQEKFHQLERAKSANQAFPCLVNPEKPEEAILFRDLRWGILIFISLFPTLFPLVGGFVAFGGMAMAQQARAILKQKSLHPEEPWKWKPQWAGTAITASRDGFAALLVMGMWILLVQLPLIAAVFASGALSESLLAILVLLPAALAIFPLRAVWRRLLARLETGDVTLQPQKWPMQPGDRLDAQICFSKTLPPMLQLSLTARCMRKVVTGAGKSSSTSEETLWEETQLLSASEARREGRGCSLPLRFELPRKLPGTDIAPLLQLSHDRREHYWELLVQPGHGTKSITLPLPVFGEAEEGEEQDREETERELESTSQQMEHRLKARGIEARFNPDGVPEYIHCPPGRNRSVAIFLIVFGALWSGVFVVLLAQGAPLLFQLIWGITAPLIECYGIYLLLHQRRLEFSSSGIRIQNQAGAFYGKTEVLEPRHIIEFTHDSYMQSGNVHYYRVRAETTFGKKITLVDGITEELTAERLQERLRRWKEAGEGF